MPPIQDALSVINFWSTPLSTKKSITSVDLRILLTSFDAILTVRALSLTSNLGNALVAANLLKDM